MTAEKFILLVEDNSNDEALTLRAMAKANIANEVVVVRDGEEALDFMFGTGAYAGRDLERMPADHQCERLPLQQLHNDEVLPFILLDGVDRADIGVVESRGCASFALKAFQ